MRRVLAAVLGSALIMATATPSWADDPLRLPNGGNAPRFGPGAIGGGDGQRAGRGAGGGGGGQRFGSGAIGGGDGQQRFGPGAIGGGDGQRPGGGMRQAGPRFGAPQDQRFGGNPGDRRRGFGGRDGFRHRDGYGAAIGAGVAGLAAGAVVGGALANQGRYYGGAYDDGYGYGTPVYGGPVYAAPDAYEDLEPARADDSTYCTQRYRSYDPDSQTYLGYDGRRHPCP